MQTIAAIPTSYAGARFRSRLEAKWAAMFDLSEWQWEYEPLDLDGYVPDFVLRFARDLVVEVKPLLAFDPDDDVLRQAMGKIDHAHPTGEALIVGAAPSTSIGWMRDADAGWGIATAFWCVECGRRSLCSEHGSWRCRATGCDTGRSMMDFSTWNVAADFRQASSLVQWRAR